MNRPPFNQRPDQASEAQDLRSAVEQSLNSEKPSKKAFLIEFAGVLVLIAGFIGYAIYLEMQDAPLLLSSPKPSSPKPRTPQPTPSAKSTNPTADRALAGLPNGTVPAQGAGTGTATLSPDEEIYQRSPKTGTYYAENSLLSASRREIVGNQGRFCIKLVNGPVSQTAGKPQVVISSLSLRNDGIYIDATQEKLQFDRSYTEITDSLGKWQLLENKADRSGSMAECLSSQDSYIREASGAGQGNG